MKDLFLIAFYIVYCYVIFKALKSDIDWQIKMFIGIISLLGIIWSIS